MGCWNQTCGMSHLPIRHGDKVRAFILVPTWLDTQHYYKDKGLQENDKFLGNGISYSNEAYQPLSWSFRAEYNDYGGVENIEEDLNTKAMFTYITKLLTTGKFKVEKEYGETTAITSFKDFETLVNDYVERGRIPFSLFLVHESIFTAAVNAVEETRDKRYETEWTVENLTKDLDLARKYLNKIDKEAKAAKALKKASPEMAKAIKEFSALGLMMWPTRPDSKYKRNAAEYFAGRGYAGGGTIDGMFALEHFNALLKNPKVSIQDMVDHLQFNSAMGTARRTYIAQAGQGSQQDNYKLHRRLAEAAVAIIGDKRKAHEADGYSDDDAETQQYLNDNY